jgi:hypothetical protein
MTQPLGKKKTMAAAKPKPKVATKPVAKPGKPVKPSAKPAAKTPAKPVEVGKDSLVRGKRCDTIPTRNPFCSGVSPGRTNDLRLFQKAVDAGPCS